MNQSLFLNDTFDNISLIPDCYGTCDNNVHNSFKTSTEDEKENVSELFENSVSFDDSKFLNEVNISNILKYHRNEENNLNIETTSDLVLEDSFDSKQQSEPGAVRQLNTFCAQHSPKENLDKNCENEKAKTNHNCALSLWSLPQSILQKYKQKGIENMFLWQAECLGKSNVLMNHANLVYSAPTSAGKTLVAEILAIKTILERNKKVLFILPYVSVVREKMFYFQEIFKGCNVRVEGFMGSYNPPGGFKSIQFAVCTIEKANSLINRLLDEGNLSDIGAVIVDEMHLIVDPSRGYLLELLLTKLKYMSIKNVDINIQIIGMSATLPNLSLLSKWLEAELYLSSYRPVPLIEQVHVNGNIYDNKLNLVRTLQNIPELGIDTDNVLQLCLETVLNSCSVLIFCPTKNWCENLAQQISLAFWKLGCSKTEMGMSLRKQLSAETIMELMEQLKRCPTGLDQELGKTVSFGVAFHHAGLTMDERDIIEAAFRSGTLRVLVATSTLSSGVNLPARRVIIRTPIFHGKPIDNLVYQQMIGRAGRMGKDSLGESFLICQKNDYKIAQELVSSRLFPIESCLEGSGKLKRAILEVIASEVATTPQDVKLFIGCTLLATQIEENKNDLIDLLEDTVKFLERNEFIRLQKQNDDTHKYVSTSLGKACLTSSLPPEEGLALFAELEKARQCFVLETELHLIYLVTPYSVCYQLMNLDWMLFFDIWEKLPPSMKRVGNLVGISEMYIVSASRGRIQNNSAKDHLKQMVHKRFYIALALQELVNEVPLNKVAGKFNCSRGLLQSLQQSASTFAGMVTSFSRQLGWSSVEILVSQFQDRLHFGVNRDLLDLMKLPVLNGPQARALHNAGIESLIDLAKADVCKIENVLHKVVPFESGKEREGESKHEVNERNKFRAIWIMGKQGITEREAAEELINEARSYIRLEMGLKNINWDAGRELELNSTADSEMQQKYQEISSKNDHDLPLNKEVITVTNTARSDSVISDHLQKNKEETNQNATNGEGNSLNNSDVIANSQSEHLSDCDNNSVYIKLVKRKRKKNGNAYSCSSDDETPYRTPTKKKKTKTKTKSAQFAAVEKFNKIKRLIGMKADFGNIEIVDVCKSQKLYDSFCKELSEIDVISLSLACERVIEKKCAIGMKILNQDLNESSHSHSKAFVYKNRNVVGLAISWGGNTSYYINLNDHDNVNESQKSELIRKIFKNRNNTVRMFDCKEHIKILKQNCNVNFFCKPEDPKVGDWMLDPDGKEKNLQAMALKYAPETVNLSQLIRNCKGVGSVSLSIDSAIESRTRACIESVICWHLMNAVYVALHEQDAKLLDTFEVEMKSISCLAKMELNGFPVNSNKLQQLANGLKKHSFDMEMKAFEMAGRRFSINSSNDIVKVLKIQRGGHRMSANKQMLQKSDNPISNVILEWRKLNGILSKTIIPLSQMIENERIYSCVITHHSTGRISMHEPNLQNIAKDFEIQDVSNNQNVTISCRSVFECSDGYVLLSADYCQLELRILAHLSQDDSLCTIMKTKKDVFRSVAAEWNNVSEVEVNDCMRQHAKQICYGIIYGVGIKTLSEQMGVCENVANEFMQSFHNRYPGIEKFIQKIIAQCEEKEYVETIAGRRRYLQYINHSNPATKAQAERQAVNTTIQGSAADIAKSAMVSIENKLQEKFSSSKNAPKLVLNLHDEFLYEVPVKYVQVMCKIIKNCMEQVMKLSVPLPVRLKTGSSWGNLKELPL